MTDPTEPHPDAGVWSEARTVRDLGELTAQWLEGRIRYLPAYGDEEPDDETAELVPTLAQVNRAGYVTICSQPGRKGPHPQRAMVDGFCGEEMAAVLDWMGVKTSLVVVSFPPGSPFGAAQIPISVDGEEPYTWAGVGHDSKSIDLLYRDDLHADAIAALQAAWQVQVFDASWGRNDALWPILRAAASSAM